MRRLALAVAAVVLVSAALLTAVAGSDERDLAFSPGVAAQVPAAVAPPGEDVCQTDVRVEARFDVIRLLLGTYGRPGPRLAVVVRDAESGRRLAGGVLPPGARDNESAFVRVAPGVAEGIDVDVCFRNEGDHRVALYGGVPWADSLSDARVGGRIVPFDLRLDFFRSEPRSALALVPDMFERAALFRPPGVGAWTYWCLLGLVLAGVPLLLAAALSSTRP
jgi:hypothetical protein